MKYLLFIITIIFISCQGNNDSLTPKLFTYFKENMKLIDSSEVLDSIRLIKLDTVTMKDVIEIRQGYIIDYRNANMDNIDILQSKLDDNIKLVKLYNGLDKTLWDHYKTEAKEQSNKIHELLLRDSLYGKSYDSLKASLIGADNKILLYYMAQCLRQYHRKDMTVKRDTVYVFLSPEKNIINREELK